MLENPRVGLGFGARVVGNGIVKENQVHIAENLIRI